MSILTSTAVDPWVERGLDGLFRAGAAFTKVGFCGTVHRNLPYASGLALDAYLPEPGETKRRRTAVLYVHGGGFQAFSKESYAIAGLQLARRGIATFVADFRLAPVHPFPAPLHDVLLAWRWVKDRSAEFGFDPQALALAGDSSGSSLCLAATLAQRFSDLRLGAELPPPPEHPPAALLLQSSFLSPADVASWRLKVPPWVLARIAKADGAYVAPARRAGRDVRLAAPLDTLRDHLGRSDGSESRPKMPPVLIGVGSQDPLLSDSQRLAGLLDVAGVRCALHVYPRRSHVFHLLPLLSDTPQAWDDQAAFLARALQTVDTGVEYAARPGPAMQAGHSAPIKEA